MTHPGEFDAQLQNLLDRADRGRLMPGEVQQLRDLFARMRAIRDLVLQDATKLRALEAVGVDNWEGYSDALAKLDEDD